MAAVAAALTLYDLEEHLSALTESVETVAPDQEMQFLEDFQAALSSAAEKRDAVAHCLAHLENQQEFAAKEISRLQKFKKEREAAQDRLELYVSYCIQSQGKDAQGKYRKLEGNSSVMFLRACPSSVEVTDIEALPLDYQNVTVTMPGSMFDDVLDVLEAVFGEDVRETIVSSVTRAADKRAIKGAFDAGLGVPGVKLITDKSTLVRR